jgi:hypothetical protein
LKVLYANQAWKGILGEGKDQYGRKIAKEDDPSLRSG